jgi:uncharacterized protein with NRDE domain
MCTVTFIPTNTGCIITSNRDEKIARNRAIPPNQYVIGEKKIIFPKDPKAGGTWMAHDENKIIVLLNGAQEKHIPKPSYKKSRGLIVLELISSKNTNEYWNSIDLSEIEPFTIIVFENKKLLQLQWNAVEKKTEEIDENQFHIWSSSTLYSKEIREKRKAWFTNFINKNNTPSREEILNFHQFTETDNKEFGLQINRNDTLKTVSITQCELIDNNIEMFYLDLFD